MIIVENLSKTFHEHKALCDVSLKVPAGQVVAIIGPSGSGKSTFLRCLNLLEIPTQGKILIKGEEITSVKARQSLTTLRQQVGMVFQHFYLFPHMTVLENLIYAPRKVKKLSKEEAIIKAETLLSQVGLAQKSSSYPAQLSGGQKQRVAIARALAMDPEIILFDEPTSALDPEMVKEVLEVIKGLAHTGITLLIVTHEMGFAREVADRVLFFDHGVLVEDSPATAFFTEPKSQRARYFLEKVL